MRPVGSNDSAAPGFYSLGYLLHVDSLAITRCRSRQRCRKKLIMAGIKDNACTDVSLRTQGDRNSEVWNPLDKIQTAADRIDNPQLRRVDRDGSVLGAFLRENPGVRIFGQNYGSNRILNIEGGFAHHVAAALPRDVSGITQTRQGDLSSFLRGTRCDFERVIEVQRHCSSVYCLHSAGFPGVLNSLDSSQRQLHARQSFFQCRSRAAEVETDEAGSSCAK